MPASVFISYKRLNRSFAERLELDLKRAGLNVWRDLIDLSYGDDFEAKIFPAIDACTHLVLPASPEAAASVWVRREVDYALANGRTVIPVRIAGATGTMPPEWERLTMAENGVTNYWGSVRKLAGQLGSPQPELPSLKSLLERGSMSVADAARELTGADEVTDVAGRVFAKLPVSPTAYGMAWLFAPPDAPLRWPTELALLFNFTNAYPGTRAGQALENWGRQVANPWMLMLEGGLNEKQTEYFVRSDCPHEWEDAIVAGKMLIENMLKPRSRIGFYFNCLVPLGFEIGLRTTMMHQSARRVYHFNGKDNRYDLAYDSWSV